MSDAAVQLARALKQLVNARLPVRDDADSDQVITFEREHQFWVAARNARATLDTYRELTGVDGEQDRR